MAYSRAFSPIFCFMFPATFSASCLLKCLVYFRFNNNMWPGNQKLGGLCLWLQRALKILKLISCYKIKTLSSQKLMRIKEVNMWDANSKFSSTRYMMLAATIRERWSFELRAESVFQTPWNVNTLHILGPCSLHLGSFVSFCFVRVECYFHWSWGQHSLHRLLCMWNTEW